MVQKQDINRQGIKVLITGITGFTGIYFYRLLKDYESIDLFATTRYSSKNINVADAFVKARIFECDINDFNLIEQVLSEVQPDIIVHLAAYVSVYRSFKNPLLTYQTNISGTLNLLEAVRRIVPESKILIPGSAEVYGKVPEDKMPIRENYPLNPSSPYAFSKKIQEEAALFYYKMFGLKVYLTRTFHYTGPGQPLGFVCSDFAKQIVDIEKKKYEFIKVGNLSAKRDFLDVRDVVNAYWQIINNGKPGEIYNVSSGNSVKIEEILNKLIIFSGNNIQKQVDNERLRPSDIPNFIGCNDKLKDIGWKQYFNIDQTLQDLLEWWRNENKW